MCLCMSYALCTTHTYVLSKGSSAAGIEYLDQLIKANIPDYGEQTNVVTWCSPGYVCLVTRVMPLASSIYLPNGDRKI